MATAKRSSEDQQRRAAQDDILVEALASGHSYREAGELAGVNARTVARRMTDQEFVRRVSDRRGERVAEVTGKLVSASSDAVRVIHEQCLEAERPADRLRAAQLLLSLSVRFRHEHELEERLRAVEGRIGLADPALADDEIEGQN